LLWLWEAGYGNVSDDIHSLAGILPYGRILSICIGESMPESEKFDGRKLAKL
jgi:hypothetical protein